MVTNDILMQTVQNTISLRKLLAPGEGLVLGVSGGADSSALLHILHHLGYRVHVAHLNHCARGEESDADEAFVVALTAQLGVPCECRKCDVTAEAKASGLSFEAQARETRYSFFASVARKHGISKIVTAHHADDQVETVLMRILRGTGPEGLSGIPYTRQWDRLSIVRPMLDCRREAIVAWLKESGLSWREDASNFDLQYRRNLVRHELLPLLEEKHNPQVREALLRLAEAQHCDNFYWEAQVSDVLTGAEEELTRATFRVWPEALQRRVIMRLAQGREIELSHERLLAACTFVCDAPTGSYCDLGGGWQLYSGADKTLLCKGQDAVSSSECIALPLPGECKALGKVFTAQVLDRLSTQELKNYCNASRQVFDMDTLLNPLFVRSRNDGDTLTPFGMSGHKKVSDLLIEKKIPAPHRETIPMLLSGEEIIWAVGVTTSQNTAVTAGTTRFLQVEVRDEAE